MENTPALKPVRLSGHTLSRLVLRGGTADEVFAAIREAKWEGAKNNCFQCRKSFPFGQVWNGKPYNTKQVKVIFQDRETEIYVVTTYVFYF